MRWYRRLHWQIILGLILGVLYGAVAAAQGWTDFTRDWIAPFGIIFINGLKLIAVPLILASLVTGEDKEGVIPYAFLLQCFEYLPDLIIHGHNCCGQ